MNKYIPRRIDAIEEYKPISGEYRIRLDANESPFPPPAAVAREFSQALGNIQFNRYPDPEADSLVAAFAKAYGQRPENIVAGNGSDELISVIINAFLSEGEGLLVTAPDFSMYEFYGALRGVKIISAPKTEDHGIDFEKLLLIIKEKNIKAVIFSNPCNPTGRAYEKSAILDFVTRANTLVILDEAYADFCENSVSLLDICADTENLIILRTLSKAFGLASLRCGFAVSNREIITALYKVKSPYNVNSVTQAFAAAALKHKRGYGELISEIIKQKNRIYDSILALSCEFGFEVYPSGANFVFARFKEGEAKRVFTELLRRGIKVRCMPPYLRITAGTPTETDEFIKAFNDIYTRKEL